MSVIVMDFGGQYKELIARCARRLGVFSEIKSGAITANELETLSPDGVILTGGPNSVYDENAKKCDPRIFELGIPILGICYGMHVMCRALGGEVSAGAGEYGVTITTFDEKSPLFRGAGEAAETLMSHKDAVTRLPDGFIKTAYTDECDCAAFENARKKLFGVQFHPETEHTSGGDKIIGAFLDICGAQRDYDVGDYMERQIEKARRQAGKSKILLALSGGVDSAVCAALLSEAVPDGLSCVFVDHGFMRLNEGDEIEEAFSDRNLNFIRVNAQKRFLDKIEGVTDPESKRKIVGAEFARVFEEEAAKLSDVRFLAQGTIYPDIIESGAGEAATIKSHHNVGGLPKNLNFDGVIEPLSGLFKDEVRVIGEKLGLPKSLTERPPFPGPGLCIRIMGAVTEEKLKILRLADYIFRDEIEKSDVKPEQYFAVFTGAHSVGVKGDKRAYDNVIALRAVNTVDFMTCSYTKIPHELLGKIASRVANEVPSVSRVVYDITSKPPATVEWE
ncbi:MAG: glutamine-hydrolyzing GMP synthase [Clostridiales bacterium]|jgi:GMP synthase (glutamine-hydrolysing)|nr:glutamine-hydrolyzing GMP synthase [Clostridiales bacterium]